MFDFLALLDIRIFGRLYRIMQIVRGGKVCGFCGLIDNRETFPVKIFRKKLFTFFNSPPFPTKKGSSSRLGEGPSNIAALPELSVEHTIPVHHA